MTLSLPARRTANNASALTAAPAAYHVLATRPRGADCCEVLLRGDLAGTPAQARRHAVLVLEALASRHPNVDVQLLGGDNLPVLVLTAGGAS